MLEFAQWKAILKVVATNRKASHEYFLLERIEAGIALHGSEIKSIRAGQMSLAEAYIRVDGDQAWLEDADIAPYEFAGIFNHEPRGLVNCCFIRNKSANFGTRCARKA